MKEKITYYEEEKYMYVTSNLFYIPTLYGFYKDFYILSTINLISTLITTKFWISGKNDIYRKIDLIYQPFNAIIFFIYGNIHSKNSFILTIGNLFFINGLFFYKTSHIEYNKKNRFWFINHNIFHLSMITANILTYVSSE